MHISLNIVAKYMPSLCVYQLPGSAIELLAWHREAIDLLAI
ncbi:hypothetical protein VCR15J2_60027 [Vibrio coralliirubri]|nr:hypothetical protein VCR15J2_60027 [Vibrio coralliirubri]